MGCMNVGAIQINEQSVPKNQFNGKFASKMPKKQYGYGIRGNGQVEGMERDAANRKGCSDRWDQSSLVSK